MRALEQQLRAQLGLIQGCCGRAVSAQHPQLKSAWINVVVRVMDASTRTGAVIADLKWAPQTSLNNYPVRLRLPQIPSLPNAENTPLPP